MDSVRTNVSQLNMLSQTSCSLLHNLFKRSGDKLLSPPPDRYGGKDPQIPAHSCLETLDASHSGR